MTEHAPTAAISTAAHARLPIVGRDAELASLGHHLELALAGQRQIVLVTGDAGIGKTTVVEAFLDGLADEGAFWIARGQCVELHGSGEPFMPVLEGYDAGSVAGVEFTVAEVAAGLAADVDTIDASCVALAKRQSLIRRIGTSEWPDGTVTGRYAFTHALYLKVLQDGVAESACRELHQRIGERLESAWGPRAPEIAAPLAVHFARAEDHARTFRYDRAAGERAVGCNAFAEAAAHFRSALRAFGRLSDRQHRVLDELQLHVALGGVLSQVQGFAAPRASTVPTSSTRRRASAPAPKRLEGRAVRERPPASTALPARRTVSDHWPPESCEDAARGSPAPIVLDSLRRGW